jgi:hypothetical protein
LAAQVNVTDGQYVYMRGPRDNSNSPLFEYTLLPHPHDGGASGRTNCGPPPCRAAALHQRGGPSSRCPPSSDNRDLIAQELDTRLYDILADPAQEQSLQDPAIEAMMNDHLVRLMRANDAPPEQFIRLGLEP